MCINKWNNFGTKQAIKQYCKLNSLTVEVTHTQHSNNSDSLNVKAINCKAIGE